MTDYLLKFLTVGQEIQGKYPFSYKSLTNIIERLPPYLKKIIDDFREAPHSSSIHRFWIEAVEIHSVQEYPPLRLQPQPLERAKQAQSFSREDVDHGLVKDRPVAARSKNEVARKKWVSREVVEILRGRILKRKAVRKLLRVTIM